MSIEITVKHLSQNSYKINIDQNASVGDLKKELEKQTELKSDEIKLIFKGKILKKDDFFQRVYHVVRRIPYGRVTTYGLIAKYLGSSSSARTVGWALNASHSDSSIPAHRVVNRNGLLTGKNHFKGFELMRQLLESEGIIIEDDKVLDFEQKIWTPK